MTRSRNRTQMRSGGIRKTAKRLSKKIYKSFKKHKRNANYRKQIKAYKKRIPYKPENDYANFEMDAVERFSTFRTALEDIQKDYPLLLEEFIWYSTLTGDEKESVKNKYKKSGFNKDLWLGVPNNEIKDYPDGSYGHPSVSWKCTIPGKGRSFHLSIGYSLSLQWFLFNGEENHLIPTRNACGPGTKIELRLSKYWALLPLLSKIAGHTLKGTYPWNVPINDTDKCCFKHDQEYSIRGQSSQNIKMADWAMLYCIKHSEKSKGTEQIKDWLIENTIKSKIGAEKFVNDGMFGLITEKVDSDEDLPKTYEEFERRTKEMLARKSKAMKTHSKSSMKTHPKSSMKTHPKSSMKTHPKSSMKTHPKSSMKSSMKSQSNKTVIRLYESLLRRFGGVVNVIISEEIPHTFNYYDSEEANEHNKNKMKELNYTEKVNVMRVLNTIIETLDKSKKKSKKVGFKSENITKSFKSYKEKTQLPMGSNISLPTSVKTKLMKTAGEMGITPRNLLISAASVAIGVNPSAITQLAQLATMASNMNA